MTFAAPLILIALLVVPALVIWYVTEQRRRERAAAAFVAPILTASVAPERPRWRRHLPMLAFLIALAVLIFAAARPERTVAVPVNDAAVMLVQDTSSSMQAKDVKPTRLGAAEHAAQEFLTKVPTSLKVGLIQFNTSPVLLQSPTTDHQEVSSALTQLTASGHTAIGSALTYAQKILQNLRSPTGKHVPGAIVLVSDGYSTQGIDPLLAARQSRTEHIPIYTISLGTKHGTLPFKRHGRTVNVVVPPSPQALGQIATTSGGEPFTVTDTAKLTAVYKGLAAELGHKQAKHEITASLAGGGLLLLLIGSGLSLRWFGRLI